MTRHRPMVYRTWLDNDAFENLRCEMFLGIKVSNRWKGGFNGRRLSGGLINSTGYEADWGITMDDAALARLRREGESR